VGLLVALFLVGQLGGFVHQATVVHARCIEHGDLVHAGGAGQAKQDVAREPWVDERARDGTPAEVRRSHGASGHGHDHCLIAFASRERVSPLDSIALVASAPPLTDTSSVSLAAEFAPVTALYRTAPKTSPPA